jgi:catechol 2,3-dioxygenase-like lactoylglutathione lyase family enzyme
MTAEVARLPTRTVLWRMRAQRPRLTLSAVNNPTPKEPVMDYKLEVVAVPVRDVDAAKSFYERIGYHTDHDHRVNDHLRFVQITPPGSDCSIVIGDGVTSAPPGSAQRMQVVVSDIERAHAELHDAGVDVGDIEDSPSGRFVYFSDPDGNSWAVQQFPTSV